MVGCPGERLQGTVNVQSAATGYYTVPGVGGDTRNQQGQAPCPVGTYCSGGLQYACPPGRFGSTEGLATRECTGPCAAGHYCEAGSTTPTQFVCGGVHVFCPVGSEAPELALPGEFTVGPTVEMRSSTAPCPSGSYCVDGIPRPCPAGRFGCAARLGVTDCNGVRAGIFSSTAFPL